MAADYSQIRFDGGRSAAAEVARLASGSHGVKAFKQAHAAVWRLRPPVFQAP
jgi:hypothetical protein